ncbi:hypothetical protein [Streptococcus hyovaginalis]|nr:hypothetical protein [Streptococcus hyovaginalis]
MTSTRTIEELTEIADYILSVMTEAEKENYLKTTDLERRSIIEKYIEAKG